jgi:hypothetical protein
MRRHDCQLINLPDRSHPGRPHSRSTIFRTGRLLVSMAPSMPVTATSAELDQCKRDREARRDSVLMGISNGLGSLANLDKSAALPGPGV